MSITMRGFGHFFPIWMHAWRARLCLYTVDSSLTSEQRTQQWEWHGLNSGCIFAGVDDDSAQKRPKCNKGRQYDQFSREGAVEKYCPSLDFKKHLCRHWNRSEKLVWCRYLFFRFIFARCTCDHTDGQDSESLDETSLGPRVTHVCE